MKFEVPKEYKNAVGIYSMTNIVNNKRLIGQTVNFWKRFRVYSSKMRNGKCGNKHFQGSYNKYGTDNFKMELLNLCDKENLTDMESYFCKAFNTMDRRFGYNKKEPTEHGKYSEESRKRMSQSQLGNTNASGHKIPEELKKKMQKINIGNKYCLGQKRSEVAKKRMSESHKGVKLSEEHRKHIGESHRGHKVSEEARRRIGLAAIGRSLGRKHTPEALKKISEASKRQIRGPMSEESKNKISEANKKKWEIRRSQNIPWPEFTEEHKRKMSESKKEYWRKRKLQENLVKYEI